MHNLTVCWIDADLKGRFYHMEAIDMKQIRMLLKNRRIKRIVEDETKVRIYLNDPYSTIFEMAV